MTCVVSVAGPSLAFVATDTLQLNLDSGGNVIDRTTCTKLRAGRAGWWGLTALHGLAVVIADAYDKGNPPPRLLAIVERWKQEHAGITESEIGRALCEQQGELHLIGRDHEQRLGVWSLALGTGRLEMAPARGDPPIAGKITGPYGSAEADFAPLMPDFTTGIRTAMTASDRAARIGGSVRAVAKLFVAAAQQCDFMDTMIEVGFVTRETTGFDRFSIGPVPAGCLVDSETQEIVAGIEDRKDQ